MRKGGDGFDAAAVLQWLIRRFVGRASGYMSASPPSKYARHGCAYFAILLPVGCGVVAADAIGAEPARPGSPVTACDLAFRCMCSTDS